VAVAHSILVIAYHLLQRQEPYRDLGAITDQQQPEATSKRLVKRLENWATRSCSSPKYLLRQLNCGFIFESVTQIASVVVASIAVKLKLYEGGLKEANA